tara:strand:+ start:167 stop:499 length:333 start_codon:yes stop_codon:yes gene_type:complete
MRAKTNKKNAEKKALFVSAADSSRITLRWLLLAFSFDNSFSATAGHIYLALTCLIACYTTWSFFSVVSWSRPVEDIPHFPRVLVIKMADGGEVGAAASDFYDQIFKLSDY